MGQSFTGNRNNCLNQGCRLAFLKLFSRIETIWPFANFWPFIRAEKTFKGEF